MAIDPEGAAKDSGQIRLEELGYKQELSRRLGLISSVASSFATIAYMMGITGQRSLPIAFINGGPVSAVWGWVICSVFNLFSALSLAEIASSYPIAGGPYFCKASCRGLKFIFCHACAGWSNLVGQFASTAGAGYLTAVHIGKMWQLGNGHVWSQFETFLAYAICMLAAGALASTSTGGMRQYILFAAFWMICGGIFLIILLPIVAPKLQTAEYVFLHFSDQSKDQLGVPNNFYLFLLGMLMGQFSYIGYEAPAQFAEETKRADRVVGWGIVLSVAASSVFGLGFLVCLLFCIQDPENLMLGPANGYVVGQIFYDIFQGRFGSVTTAIVLLAIPLIAIFNTTVMCLFTAARMLWSFSRDGGVPLYRVWAAINKRTGTPLNATWAMTATGFLLGLPMLFSNAAFLAMGSVTAVGLNASYAVPILLRLIFHKNFNPGPFKLGRAQPLINVIAISWLTFSVVCFALPTIYPVDVTTLNWTPVMLGLVIVGVLISWYLPRCGARHWYHGKAHTLEDANVVSPFPGYLGYIGFVWGNWGS
ncbi:amino acid transporter [Coccomyxa subellipsoidea C-169]|uniref:Amino acid transporter n=1 Tax=Coccomyxa subellipsoidea (strain C-169) TaxID=574566 RepID=I0Z348_COCSC|nr:amino acid transporter [Coccomyxa subellipsoidea C-169]EIE25067.1 amino acid transporter [Coccomyxa subellipsoidea C-169]|eukprot:XP_005649611.1 amino acid transporter [Coccomyxa subellipsoidea C-169]